MLIQIAANLVILHNETDDGDRASPETLVSNPDDGDRASLETLVSDPDDGDRATPRNISI